MPLCLCASVLKSFLHLRFLRAERYLRGSQGLAPYLCNLWLNISFLDYFHACIGRIQFEDLEDVDLLRAGREAGIPEDGTERLALRDFLDDAFGDVCIETRDQIAVVVGVDGATVNLFGFVRQGQRQPPVKHTPEQQVEVGAVFLDVRFRLREQILRVVARRVVDVLHVRVCDLQDAEADVRESFTTDCTDTRFAGHG